MLYFNIVNFSFLVDIKKMKSSFFQNLFINLRLILYDIIFLIIIDFIMNVTYKFLRVYFLFKLHNRNVNNFDN